MKKILTFVYWVWQNLKYWCDPAMEGDPYVIDFKMKKDFHSDRPSLSRRFVFGRF